MNKRKYSNAGKYPCPSCNHMNPITNRDLGICMNCMGGDKYSRFVNPWDDSSVKQIIPKE